MKLPLYLTFIVTLGFLTIMMIAVISHFPQLKSQKASLSSDELGVSSKTKTNRSH